LGRSSYPDQNDDPRAEVFEKKEISSLNTRNRSACLSDQEGQIYLPASALLFAEGKLLKLADGFVQETQGSMETNHPCS
jgi:hypothetical protein